MDFALAGRLAAVCGVIALVLYGVQFLANASLRSRFARPTNGKLVTLLETTYLPNASSLHVIRAAERYYVVGRSGAHIATLCEIPAQSVPVRPARPGAGNFPPQAVTRLMNRLRRRP